VRAVDIFISVGWLAFWIYWLVASTGAKAGRGRWTQFAGFRVGIVLVVLLLLRVLNGHEVTSNPWLLGIGTVIFVLGLALAVWARICIGRNWGMPMSRKHEPELVTSGPYHTIRHPIYAGIILAMAGTTIAVTLYWFIAVAALGVYFSASAVTEERYLTEQFPDAYPEYKHSTKMLIPYVF
jgi:protein-S-isoprenylcysteine O-methyltransferase Ste14